MLIQLKVLKIATQIQFFHELKDDALIQKEIILGFLNTSTVSRIKYLNILSNAS